MNRQDFYFDLPEELIAKIPAETRRASRLLCVDGRNGQISDRQFEDLLTLVNAGDLMVFNNTKVIPARIFGQKSTGGKVEILIERIIDSSRALAHVRASKAPKSGSEILLEDGSSLSVQGRQDDLFLLHFNGERSAMDVLEVLGHIPLPPYIDRADSEFDRERYQTVYGQVPGAVAAPTAGLHFDDKMLEQLRSKGVDIVFVTLHVGAGTFRPVRVDDIREHQMHSEFMSLSVEVAEKVKAVKSQGGRVIAVGTTSVRCLESAARNGVIEPYEGDTQIFIYPGYDFKIIDALVTNFHLPESTLLMLVSAFAGYQNTMSAYHHAVNHRYRFFSYGDAMFLTRNPNAQSEFSG